MFRKLPGELEGWGWLQPPAAICYLDPARLSALASLVAAMPPAPRCSWGPHGAGGTSIISMQCTDKPRITKQGQLVYRTAQRIAGTRAENAVKPGKCCKSNALLLPSTPPTEQPLSLSIVFTILQLWSNWDWLKKKKIIIMGPPLEVFTLWDLHLKCSTVSRGKGLLPGFMMPLSCRPQNPSRARRWAQTL